VSCEIFLIRHAAIQYAGELYAKLYDFAEAYLLRKIKRVYLLCE